MVPSAPIPEAIPSVGEIWVRPMSKRVTLISGLLTELKQSFVPPLTICSGVKQFERER